MAFHDSGRREVIHISLHSWRDPAIMSGILTPSFRHVASHLENVAGNRILATTIFSPSTVMLRQTKEALRDWYFEDIS